MRDVFDGAFRGNLSRKTTVSVFKIQTLFFRMPSTMSSSSEEIDNVTQDPENDDLERTKQVMTLYFITTAVILGILLFIAIRKSFKLIFFEYFYSEPKSEETEFMPASVFTVPSVLLNLQKRYEEMQRGRHSSRKKKHRPPVKVMAERTDDRVGLTNSEVLPSSSSSPETERVVLPPVSSKQRPRLFQDGADMGTALTDIDVEKKGQKDVLKEETMLVSVEEGCEASEVDFSQGQAVVMTETVVRSSEASEVRSSTESNMAERNSQSLSPIDEPARSKSRVTVTDRLITNLISHGDSDNEDEATVRPTSFGSNTSEREKSQSVAEYSHQRRSDTFGAADIPPMVEAHGNKVYSYDEKEEDNTLIIAEQVEHLKRLPDKEKADQNHHPGFHWSISAQSQESEGAASSLASFGAAVAVMAGKRKKSLNVEDNEITGSKSTAWPTVAYSHMSEAHISNETTSLASVGGMVAAMAAKFGKISEEPGPKPVTRVIRPIVAEEKTLEEPVEDHDEVEEVGSTTEDAEEETVEVLSAVENMEMGSIAENTEIGSVVEECGVVASFRQEQEVDEEEVFMATPAPSDISFTSQDNLHSRKGSTCKSIKGQSSMMDVEMVQAGDESVVQTSPSLTKSADTTPTASMLMMSDEDKAGLFSEDPLGLVDLDISSEHGSTSMHSGEGNGVDNKSPKLGLFGRFNMDWGTSRAFPVSDPTHREPERRKSRYKKKENKTTGGQRIAQHKAQRNWGKMMKEMNDMGDE